MLKNAIAAYQKGDYRQCLKLLGPTLAGAKVDSKLLLMAAQSNVKLNNMEKAAEYYARAAAIDPKSRRMLTLLAARTYQRASRQAAALRLAREAVGDGAFDIEAENTYRQLLRSQLCLGELEAQDARLLALMKAGEPAAFAVDDPHDHIMWCDDEALNARITRMHGGTAFTPQSRAERRALPHAFGDRIRVGYLSNDLSDQHATMRLFQGVLLHHDPAKFDITLFCYSSDALIATDQGLRSRYGRIVRIGDLDDTKARETIRAAAIDILVDLKGHTKDARVSLVNSGLAPIQVAYLGFPGCGTGIDCDYILGDAIVTPEASQPFYHEQVCRLPECYQANDGDHRVLPPPALRADLGLPEDAIVIASFNATKKITPLTARLWAEVLRAVPKAVLWMMCDDLDARSNFTDFMADHGVSSDRIIFASRANYPEHVARLQAADFAVDSFPTNGHTTTSDKLWAGLPVVTRRGRNFTSRVSESLMTTLGIPELVAADDRGFVDLSVALARDPERLASLKARIAEHRFRSPLFDTERFTRHLERAYEIMVDRQIRGLAPAPFDVPRLPAREAPFRQA